MILFTFCNHCCLIKATSKPLKHLRYRDLQRLIKRRDVNLQPCINLTGNHMFQNYTSSLCWLHFLIEVKFNSIVAKYNRDK